MTIVKISITIVLIKYIGIWGAPIGTAISYLIGHGIIMNVYYSKRIQLEVKRMFKEIFTRIWIVLILTSLICSPLLFWANVNFFSFGVKVMIYIIIYSLLLMAWGFNKEEKQIVNSLILKFKR